MLQTTIILYSPISTAIDSGDNSYISSNTSTDLAGNMRIFNLDVDLGVYEFNASLSVNNINFTEADIKVYPNPTAAILNVKSPNISLENITIFDLLGKEVMNTNQTKINVSNLKSGVYLIKISTDSGVLTKRFIKN